MRFLCELTESYFQSSVELVTKMVHVIKQYCLTAFFARKIVEKSKLLVCFSKKPRDQMFFQILAIEKFRAILYQAVLVFGKYHFVLFSWRHLFEDTDILIRYSTETIVSDEIDT